MLNPLIAEDFNAGRGAISGRPSPAFKLLHILRDDVKLLSVPKVPRKMLTSEQKLRVFETASARPEWQLAYCAALLTPMPVYDRSS